MFLDLFSFLLLIMLQILFLLLRNGLILERDVHNDSKISSLKNNKGFRIHCHVSVVQFIFPMCINF